MDWSAVALLLAERAGLPVMLLDERGDILFVAPAAQRLLGWRDESIGKCWEQFAALEGLPSARWLISKALDGATHHFEIKMLTPKGTALVSFESYPVGYEHGRGVLLFVEGVELASEHGPRQEFDYEVDEVSAGGYRLRSLRAMGEDPSNPDGSCYEVLHNRSSACPECPVKSLGKPQDICSVASRSDRAEIEVKTARLVEGNRARVSVRRLPEASFSAMLQARLDELSTRGELSKRERDVLGYLIDGRTFEEIGALLGITARTVKYHQAKLLEKLGADSRSDLIRLIF